MFRFSKATYKILGLVLCLSLLFSLCGCAKKRSSISWFDMFDTVTVLLGYTSTEEEFSQYSGFIKEKLMEYHKLYDIYHSYPNMNNLKTVNDNAGVAPVKVDQKIIDLILLGKELYTLTNGKTNIAMGSVLSLWHDARETAEENPDLAALPDQQALQEAALHTNINKVIVDQENSTVFLEDSQMRLDVGSLGKGYAAEMVCQAAQEQGFTSGLLSVGGNLRAIGKKPDGMWTGGIQNPWNPGESSDYTVYLQDCSLVTSGDYQRFFEVGGKRYHHIIDPATQMPANYVNSVSVRCKDSGVADGLSTALFNMPVEEGMALIESLPDTEAIWMLPDHTVKMSSGFDQWCKEP